MFILCSPLIRATLFYGFSETKRKEQLRLFLPECFGIVTLKSFVVFRDVIYQYQELLLHSYRTFHFNAGPFMYPLIKVKERRFFESYRDQSRHVEDTPDPAIPFF